MSAGDWDDDDAYPSAPLPPHERSWRHPSELGLADGPRRPPVVPTRLARWAVAGIGALSAAVVVGLIQLLLPSPGQRITRLATQPELADTTLVGASLLSDPQTGSSTTPGPSRASNARAGSATATLLVVRDHRAAVAVGDGRHALTTAEALQLHQALEVRLADGSSVTATVRSINRAKDVAVLELTAATRAVAAKIAASPPADGDPVTVGDVERAVIRITSRGVVVQTAAPTDEGAPVLDRDGELVGLVTTGADGTVYLIPIPASAAVEATAAALGVWLGVRFTSDSLTVAAVAPGSPAQRAGVLSGDLLVTLGSEPLNNLDDVWDALAQLAPGDSVPLALRRQGHLVELDVTVAARPS